MAYRGYEPPPEDETPNPALKNPAVAYCHKIWKSSYPVFLDKHKNRYMAARCSAEAYRSAMPLLQGYQNITDFIACVGYGMAVGTIHDIDGGKLLYAAQVALNAVFREDKREPKAKKSTPSPPPISPQTNETI